MGIENLNELNRVFYMNDSVGKSISVNGCKIEYLYIPIITNIEREGFATVDDIVMALRDSFGSRYIQKDEFGYLDFQIPICGKISDCMAKYEILDSVLIIIEIKTIGGD